MSRLLYDLLRDSTNSFESLLAYSASLSECYVEYPGESIPINSKGARFLCVVPNKSDTGDPGQDLARAFLYSKGRGVGSWTIGESVRQVIAGGPRRLRTIRIYLQGSSRCWDELYDSAWKEMGEFEVFESGDHTVLILAPESLLDKRRLFNWSTEYYQFPRNAAGLGVVWYSMIPNAPFHQVLLEHVESPVSTTLLSRLEPWKGLISDDILSRILSRHFHFALPFIRFHFRQKFSEAAWFALESEPAWLRSVFETGTHRKLDRPLQSVVSDIAEMAFLSIAESRARTVYAHKGASDAFRSSWDDFMAERACAICGEHFRVCDRPYWIHRDVNGYRNVCFRCPIREEPPEAELITRLRDFVDQCGFLPGKDAAGFNYRLFSRLQTQQVIPVIRALGRLGNLDSLVSHFGSWDKALVAAGLWDGIARRGTFGARCVASDGHVCNSFDELYIDNWLTTNGIPHEKEPLYPFHPVLNPGKRLRADWRIGGMLVEYFGLVSQKAYSDRIAKKQRLAHLTGTHLISLYPDDLGSLATVIRKQLPGDGM